MVLWFFFGFFESEREESELLVGTFGYGTGCAPLIMDVGPHTFLIWRRAVAESACGYDDHVQSKPQQPSGGETKATRVIHNARARGPATTRTYTERRAAAVETTIPPRPRQPRRTNQIAILPVASSPTLATPLPPPLKEISEGACCRFRSLEVGASRGVPVYPPRHPHAFRTLVSRAYYMM